MVSCDALLVYHCIPSNLAIYSLVSAKRNRKVAIFRYKEKYSPMADQEKIGIFMKFLTYHFFIIMKHQFLPDMQIATIDYMIPIIYVGKQ